MLLWAAIPALFVGNQACVGCHSDIVNAYAKTPMALSSGRVTTVTPGVFRQRSSGVQYNVDSSGATRFSRGQAAGVAKLEYYIGSGAAGRSFLSRRGDHLFEAPLTWYTGKNAWDASPGYESDGASRWSRAVEPSCLFCHASQTQWRENTQNAYRDPPFRHDGISCERCHGPGSLHIEGKGALVNPGKLEPTRRDSVCAQCHLSGEARIARAGRRLEDFRPGDLLTDFAVSFVSEDRSNFQVNSHVEKLAQSRCKQAAGDRLWCGSCHDPHRVPAPAESAAFFRERCESCHDAGTCFRGPDCAGCHMPKANAADANHGVFTDHSIPRIPAKRNDKPAASMWRLRGFSAADAGQRELGLAYAEVAARTGDRRQQAEALRLLTVAPQDAETQARLAYLVEQTGDVERAAKLYLAAIKADPNQIVATVNLGRLLGVRGFLDEAITLWRQALNRNPCLEEAGTNLAMALRAVGNAVAAEEVRRKQTGCVF